MKERLATLISGGGTTMQAIVKASKSGLIPIDIACVISSSPGAGGLEKAKNLGISDIFIIDPNSFRGQNKKVDQDAFGSEIVKTLRSCGVTVVTQNGWMPLTPERVIEEYKNIIFNQHPGPVPEFGGKGMYGKRVHAARILFTRLTKRDNWTEAIAQRVDKEFDKGSVVKSEKIEILPNDTVEDLQQRVLPVEHRVQIELLKDVVNGSVKEVGKRESLVNVGEEHILFRVKEVAKILYPNG